MSEDQWTKLILYVGMILFAGGLLAMMIFAWPSGRGVSTLPPAPPERRKIILTDEDEGT